MLIYKIVAVYFIWQTLYSLQFYENCKKCWCTSQVSQFRLLYNLYITTDMNKCKTEPPTFNCKQFALFNRFNSNSTQPYRSTSSFPAENIRGNFKNMIHKKTFLCTFKRKYIQREVCYESCCDYKHSITNSPSKCNRFESELSKIWRALTSQPPTVNNIFMIQSSCYLLGFY